MVIDAGATGLAQAIDVDCGSQGGAGIVLLWFRPSPPPRCCHLGA